MLCSADGERSVDGRGLVAGSPRPAAWSGGAGPPRFLGNPCTRALLFDPGETFMPGHFGMSARPSAYQTASALATSTFSGLNHTAHVLAVYTSPPGLPQTAQDSLPAAGQALPGGLLPPPGFR